MKNYKTLLFDIDDTLLDFGAAEKLALKNLFEEQNFTLTTEIYNRYKVINQGLWKAFEEGQINREEVLNTRFSLLFNEFGKDVDGALLENCYRGYLEQSHQLIEGAYELILALQHHFDLYIVTNGDTKTQDKRLKDSNLFPLFKNVFISEETGYQKPMKEFFDYVFDRIPNVDLKEVLIIGDSLSADIKGGRIAGIDTCWFNPKDKLNNTDMIPTYEVQKLEEIYEILKVQPTTVGV